MKGFASSNLRYMAKFYSLYTPMIFPQVVEKSGNEKFPQVVGDLKEEDLFAVPWGHYRMIIDRCKEDTGKAAFLSKKRSRITGRGLFLKTFLIQISMTDRAKPYRISRMRCRHRRAILRRR